MRRKKLKKMRRRKKKNRKTLRSTTQLTEINKLLIKQELQHSMQLFLKRMMRRKELLLSPLSKIRPLKKLLLEKRMVSRLMTTKEEELLHQPETPKDSSIPKTRDSTVICTVPDTHFPNKETKLNSTEP